MTGARASCGSADYLAATLVTALPQLVDSLHGGAELMHVAPVADLEGGLRRQAVLVQAVASDLVDGRFGATASKNEVPTDLELGLHRQAIRVEPLSIKAHGLQNIAVEEQSA